jgi:hypothetical protein
MPDATYEFGRYRITVPTREELVRLAAIGPIPQGDLTMRAYGLGLLVLDGFFGRQWTERHIMNDRAQRGFLNRFSDDERFARSVGRILDLAELVIGMAPVPFVGTSFSQLIEGAVESGVAELEAAKLLLFNGVRFRFVEQSNVKGRDFDILITLDDGQELAGEVKSVADLATLTEVGVTKRLRRRVDNALPKSRL